MDTLMALQNLAVTVNGLKDSIDLENRRVSAIMSSNDTRVSEYHSKFSELLTKYSSFAVSYKFELDSLHKGLINSIECQQKEREEQERLFQDKLETLSNKSNHSNLEIEENVNSLHEDSAYNSSTFNSNIGNISPNGTNNMSSQDIITTSDPETIEQPVSNTVSVQIPSEPQPMKSKKSVPFSAPKSKPKQAPKSKPTPKRNNNVNRSSPKKKVQQSPVINKPTPAPKPAAKLFVRTVSEQQQNQTPEDTPYVYKPEKIRFSEQFENWTTIKDQETGKTKKLENIKHSTTIYIGNIPSNIKIKAVEFFIVKRMKVTLRHFSFDLKKGARGSQYALVNFRGDVDIKKIMKFMNDINSENAQIAEEKKKAKDTIPMKKSSKNKDNDKDKKGEQKKKLKTSWQTRVYIKLPEPSFHFSYYETEDEMYNDYRANHSLFIKNFDILDENCHEELTNILLNYGDLYKDIDIRIDRSNDPFAIVIFKYINDAIYCCNSDIYYNNKRLEIRYSKF